jgi:dihydrolipoyl dehydrogenase
MASLEYDLAVIGAGPGGYVAAIRAAQLGLRVACVEEAAGLGGTCLRIGCIPSKALLESSERYAEAQHQFAAHGIRFSEIQLDVGAMLRRKDQIVTTLTRGVEALFKKNKITRYQGRGRLEGPGRVRVEAATGALELNARHILLATGSIPAGLPGIQLDGERIGSSTAALAYTEVPKHLVVIGAGYIGLELGSVWLRLGAQVTVLEFLDRILAGLDAGLAGEAQQALERQGFKFRLGCKVTSARVQDGRCVVEIEGQAPITCDRALLAVGRLPNTRNLGLERAGIELDQKGFVRVTEHFATTAEGIYAIGDIVGGPMLAHKGGFTR